MSRGVKRKGAEQRYNLKMMRKHMPAPDLLNIGEKPIDRPKYDPSMKKPYVLYKMFPETLDELREQCGVHGEAAVVNLQWRSVGVWLMKDPADNLLTHDMRISTEAVILLVEHDRYRLGFPDWRGWERSPVLDDLDPQYRRVIEQVAKDTMADWEAAGSPYLTSDRIKTAYQYINACVANEVALLLTKETVA